MSYLSNFGGAALGAWGADAPTGPIASTIPQSLLDVVQDHRWPESMLPGRQAGRGTTLPGEIAPPRQYSGDSDILMTLLDAIIVGVAASRVTSQKNALIAAGVVVALESVFKLEPISSQIASRFR